MAEYLSKEEIRQWRSSLERITLEEFARRLGKVINEEKSTNDVVDKVMKDITFDNTVKPEYQTRSEKIIVVAQKALQREKELVNRVMPKASGNVSKQINEIANSILPKTDKKIAAPKKVISEKSAPDSKKAVQKVNKDAKKPTAQKSVHASKSTKSSLKKETKSDFPFALKKAFTQREQVVFDYLYTNKNQVVYAKDLAELLGLPRDYIYKYIKGIRSKMEVDKLSNAVKGGFVLNV